MANWKHSIKIGDLHDKYEAEEMTIAEVGLELSRRLRATPYADDLLDVIEELECGVEDVESYVYLLGEVYDFGDTDHRLWLAP